MKIGQLILLVGGFALAGSAVIAQPGGKLLAQPSSCVTPFSNCRAAVVTNDLLDRGCLHSDPGSQLQIEPGYVADTNGKCVKDRSGATDGDMQMGESHVDWNGKN